VEEALMCTGISNFDHNNINGGTVDNT
jgi:hypothetical protein